MAEKNINRDYKEVAKELFIGKESAISKYAKVRHTYYEMSLWRYKGLPLSEVYPAEKKYFSERFLEGKRIDNTDRKTLDKAFTDIRYAIGLSEDGKLIDSGCRGRCHKLIKELNKALSREGLATISNVDKFLDWLTFSYEVQKDSNGVPISEPEYGFELRHFNDAKHLELFSAEIKSILNSGLRMSMQDIYKVVLFKKRVAKSVPKSKK